ncbi:glycosyltransferase [Butyrivibrio fibrisolvens]|uniref:glycosyltransferase n=1 Tax=Butyrivibrio fibrisolvens TaxID=831 RepID=UPI000419050F|nr:glycosyltransferase [Butyrivibrio fibrisolvens]
MKVLQINIFGNLSTGRIAVDIYRTLHDNGHDGMVAFSRNTISDDVPHFQFGSTLSVVTDGVMTRITDRAGFFSIKATKRLIEKIKDYNPDIVHIHNLHGYYINIDILFNYLKESGKPVVWTLHDCWSFTGHCCNFESMQCEKWKTICKNCNLKHSYPSSFILDNSTNNFIVKKRLFTSLDKMILVTPSVWLKDLVNESYMNKYPVEIIRNGVDLDVFRPTYGNWIKNHGLERKKIVLGVAGTWSKTKGLNDMIKLAEILPDDYQVVVVGVSKKQHNKMPKNVLAIERTYDSKELAEIYTAAFVFVNPSYEDNFPNVNIEALACGTPVITYETGGGPEIITDEIGSVVNRGEVNAIANEILKLNVDSEKCTTIAQEFDRKKCYLRYLDVYKSLMN